MQRACLSTNRLRPQLLDEFAAGVTLTGLHIKYIASIVDSSLGLVLPFSQSAPTSCFRRTTKTRYAASPTNSHRSALSSVDCNRCVRGLMPSAGLPVASGVALNVATDGQAIRLTRLPTSPPATTSSILSTRKRRDTAVAARSDRRQFTDEALEVDDNVAAARQTNG